MKKQKYTISILDFIKTGKFDNIELGMTKKEILNILSSPDYSDNDIWCYSTFEFHFFEDELISLWCDWLDRLKSPRKKQFKLNRSFINYNNNSLEALINRLNKEKITYTLAKTYYAEGDNFDSVLLKPNCAETVMLHFEPKDDTIGKLLKYQLIAIGSSIHYINNKIKPFVLE